MKTQQNIWNKVLPFRSTKYTQTILRSCYEINREKESEALAFQNTYPFIYYLEHGEKYFSQVQTAPIELRPVLLFYGMVQLMKACLLLKDPHYPETSQVLAHGVTTRKRKKSQYVFLDDEVKIQKNGLLTHFSEKMFHVKHFSSEKYKMRLLLRQIFEMHTLFTQIENMKRPYFIQFTENNLTIPAALLDEFQFGISSFCSYISERSKQKFQSHLDVNKDQRSKDLHITGSAPICSTQCHPFLFASTGNYYLSPYKNELLDIPEIIVHYLILYNLSMICRYETEWWGELFHHYPDKDYPFIYHFLSVAAEKVPLLLFSIMEKQVTASTPK
ncbi:YaaC family protein [Alkalihalobacillus sp. BA299]|uniref:YaaC family protein n=1 Tax=Alkalihalobacillus sp. BA299 TaxID=2815938 RepID=UPI001ADB9DE3|nr:YaaC family protein [Alkalihalobacillus sp. BA299]